MSEIDPDIWFLGTTAVQLSLDWLAERQPWVRDDLPGLKVVAQEIAPGVRVTVLGTGDCLLPDGQVRSGAQIAVWREADGDRLMRRLRGFNVEGLENGGTEARCWHCGVSRTFGDAEDGVLVADVAAWCDSHVCPGLAVT